MQTLNTFYVGVGVGYARRCQQVGQRVPNSPMQDNFERRSIYCVIKTDKPEMTKTSTIIINFQGILYTQRLKQLLHEVEGGIREAEA